MFSMAGVTLFPQVNFLRSQLLPILTAYKYNCLYCFSEYEDLREGQLVLQKLVERQGIPVFDNVAVAMNCTALVLRENATVEEVGARLPRSDSTAFS